MALSTEHDIVIHNGTIYDGSGAEPFAGDVAIDGDRIAAVGPGAGERGRVEVDASGLAVAPLSSPTRVSAMAPVDAFWGTRTGPAPHRLPYPSACSGAGSAVPPNDT